MKQPPRKIYMPRVNANDENGVLRRWIKPAGARVSVGELIAEIETTKAIVEIEADADGYLHPLVGDGTSLPIGEPLAIIAASYDPQLNRRAVLSAGTPPPSAGERMISHKAQAMLDAAGLTVLQIPGDGPIREETVRQALAAAKPIVSAAPIIEKMKIDENAVALYGAAEQGVVVADCLQASGTYHPICFIDERPIAGELFGVPVFRPDAIDPLHRRGVRLAHVCIAAPEAKKRVSALLETAGFTVVNVIHPRATVSSRARLGKGVFIGPGVVVGPEAVIGDYCQINNNATIPHHVTLGWGVRISDGTNVAGGVKIGDRSFLGLGVTVNTGCYIGDDVTVVSGVAVFDSVPNSTVVRGPALRR